MPEEHPVMRIDFCCIIFLSDFNAITLAHNF